MANDYKQSTSELQTHLQEHLEFLRSSADAFDSGFEGEAKRIAVSIRVLVHDTQQSASLLGQLNRKSGQFFNSALPVVAGNKGTYSGLVVMSMVPGVGAKYVAFLDEGPTGAANYVPFDSWWHGVVFVDSKGNGLSRKDLVLAVANKDGGAHVDKSLDRAYAELSRNNSLGWVYTDGTTSQALDAPEKAALRQICHEILKTLVPGYVKAPKFPEGGMQLGGITMLTGADARRRTAQLQSRRKVGRNESCPCGSGTKYKRCCGTVV